LRSATLQDFAALIIAGGGSLLALGFGLPLMLRKIRRNCYYGYRITRDVMSDDDIWYEVNAMGGRHMVTGSVFLGAIAMVSLAFVGDPGAQSTLVLITLVTTTAGMAYSTWRAYRLSNRLAADKGLRT
jgi:ABC-type antimicrobial peptide transport system permease subunit